MGKLSCAVPLSFAGLNLSALLSFVSLGSRGWIIGTSKNITNTNIVVFGLFDYCVDDECHSQISDGVESGWVLAALVLHVVAEVLLLVSLASFCGVSVCHVWKNSKPISALSFFTLLIAAICMLIALCLVGKGAMTLDLSRFLGLNPDVKVGWGFYVALLNCIVLFLCCVFNGRTAYVIRAMPVVYQDIQ